MRASVAGGSGKSVLLSQCMNKEVGRVGQTGGQPSISV